MVLMLVVFGILDVVIVGKRVFRVVIWLFDGFNCVLMVELRCCILLCLCIVMKLMIVVFFGLVMLVIFLSEECIEMVCLIIFLEFDFRLL